MKFSVAVSLAVLVGASGACGDPDDGSPIGTDVTVTFDALPEAERAQFEAWKALPLKACAWEQAFPGLAERFPPPVGAARAAVDRAVAAVTRVPHAADFVDAFTGALLQDCLDAPALADLVAFGVASKHTFCALDRSRTEQARCVDPSLDRLSAGPGGLLAATRAARHAELARTLTARWPSLDSATYFDTRFDIQEAFFRGMWLGCDAAGFARSRARLLERITALLAAPAFDARFAIQEEIARLVDATTCP